MSLEERVRNSTKKPIFSWVSVADPHFQFNERYGHINVGTGLHTRLEEKIGLLRKAVKFAIENGVDQLLILGDVFHKMNPPERLKAMVFRELIPFFNQGEVVVLVGNHDRVSSREYNFLPDQLILTEFIDPKMGKVFSIVATPETRSIDGGKFEIDYIPWAANRDVVDFMGSRKKIPRIGFGHLAPSGSVAALSGGKPVATMDNGIPMESFKPYMDFETGDIHMRQNLPPVRVVGTMAHQDLSEADRLSMPALSHGRVYNDDNKYQVVYDYISLEDRDFLAYKVTPSSTAEDVIYVKDNKLKISDTSSILPGAVLKVTLKGTEEWCSGIPTIMFREECKEIGVHWLQVDTEMEGRSLRQGVPEISTSSFEEGIGELTEDPELRKMGLEILSEAMGD